MYMHGTGIPAAISSSECVTEDRHNNGQASRQSEPADGAPTPELNDEELLES